MSYLNVSRDGKLATVLIDRHEKGNSLNPELLKEIYSTFNELSIDNKINVVNTPIPGINPANTPPNTPNRNNNNSIVLYFTTIFIKMLVEIPTHGLALLRVLPFGTNGSVFLPTSSG